MNVVSDAIAGFQQSGGKLKCFLCGNQKRNEMSRADPLLFLLFGTWEKVGTPERENRDIIIL